MSALVATRPRRIAWALLAAFVSASLEFVLLWRADAGTDTSSGTEPSWARLLMPPIAFAVAYLVASLVHRPASARPAISRADTAPPPSVDPVTTRAHADVVGVHWINPLQHRNYPTPWQLLWTLGLARPNEDDERAIGDPDAFAGVKVTAPVVRSGSASLEDLFAGYVDKLLDTLHDTYFHDPNGLYNVCAEEPHGRRSLDGIHVICAVPAALDQAFAHQRLLAGLAETFDLDDSPSSDRVPVIRLVPGGVETGPAALSLAFDHLQACPGKTVWLLAWDAPDFEQSPRLNESLVLLVLAGPDARLGHAVLARLGHPVSFDPAKFESSPEQPRRVRAWQAALDAAADRVGRSGEEIGYVIHDAGHSPDNLGPLMQTLSTTLSEFDVLAQTFNTPALLGNRDACATATDIALAVGHAYHFGRPVAVTRTTSMGKVAALVVTPHPGSPVRKFPPTWFRARSEAHARQPWWVPNPELVATTGPPASLA